MQHSCTTREIGERIVLTFHALSVFEEKLKLTVPRRSMDQNIVLILSCNPSLTDEARKMKLPDWTLRRGIFPRKEFVRNAMDLNCASVWNLRWKGPFSETQEENQASWQNLRGFRHAQEKVTNSVTHRELVA